MKNRELNATDLFGKPNRKYHNSESFWSSLFALYILTVSTTKNPLNLPAFQLHMNFETKQWEYKEDGNFEVPKDLSLSDVIVEGKISETSFNGIDNIPDGLSNLRPDILIKKNKKIYMIEIKTIGHRIGERQKNLYVDLVNFLEKNKYNANLYFLLSIGHENKSDERLLANNDSNNFKILLWEKVLEEICKSTNELGKCLGDISAYYKDIKLQGNIV